MSGALFSGLFKNLVVGEMGSADSRCHVGYAAECRQLYACC